MMDTYHETEVAIVGAGAVGSSIAYYLAKRGVQVTVFDKEGLAAGTSSATLGLVWVQGKKPAQYMELNRASSLLHAKLAKRFNEDAGLVQPGGLIICPDEDEFDQLVEVTEELNRESQLYQARVLTRDELNEMVPSVSKKVAGGIFGPHDGWVNSLRYVFNVSSLAKKNGAKFEAGVEADCLLTHNNEIQGLHTENGTVLAQHVVLAAGLGVSKLAATVDIDIPLTPIRGEILVTAPVPPFLDYPTRHVMQTDEGNLLLGSTHDRGIAERLTTVGSAASIADNAVRTFPFLRDIPIIRQYAGIRPMPVDGLPYLGEVSDIPGLYIAVGHSGITLSPMHGKVISELIVDGETEIDIDLYRPDRYSDITPQKD